MKNIFVFIIIFSYIVNLSPNLFAAEQFLETCVQFALARDKRVNVARQQISLSKRRVVRSARAFLPMVSFERKTSKGKTINAEYKSEEQGLRAFQPIYEGGKNKATYQYDSLMYDSSLYNYTKVREDLIYRIKATYFEFLTAKMESEKLKKAFDEIDMLSRKVRIEFKAKAISELELLEAINFRDKVENMMRAAQMNYSLMKRNLESLICVNDLDEIPMMLPEGLPQDVPEISYTLEECMNFTKMNNVDIKISAMQVEMAERKDTIIQSKIIPKIYLDGFYGRSGEVFVDRPLDLATVWSVSGKMAWTLWGNSTEVSQSSERASPSDVLDTQSRIDTNSITLKVGLLDDFSYFVDAKESNVGIVQATAQYEETYKKVMLELEKAFNEYRVSLFNARTFRNEVSLKEKKLLVLKKKNDLYEASTIQYMEETERYSETIVAYAKSLAQNYSSVANLERFTITPLR